VAHRKIVLIGAGSASFTVGLVADLLISNIADEWTVGLVDINEEALGVARGLVERMVEKKQAPVTVEASTDRCDVLADADIVVTTIAVGGRPGWEADVVIPRQHGIFQPVGDTIGAGGISRALRQIPPMIDIAWDVAELCPDAFFFNYANPMACLTRAVNKATPVDLVGLCHGVQGTLRHLCNFIDVPYAEVNSLYCGINHLTFITHFTRDGESLWPLVDEKLEGLRFSQPGGAALQPAQGGAVLQPAQGGGPAEARPLPDNPFSWELYRTHGAFPAVLDRHITEFYSPRFASGAYYGQQLGVDTMDILETIHSGDERYQRMKDQAEGREPLEDSLFERVLGEHEALIPILESVFADRQELFPMNVPNCTVPEVPPDFVLEMPTCATRAGCMPIAMPPLRPALAATITRALYGVELTVEAALTGDRQTLIESLLYDGCVLELAQAEALADDLLAAHKEHLPQFE